MLQNLLAKFFGELGLQLIAAEVDPDCLRVRAASTQPSAACPQCHQESAKVHSGYERTLADLAFGPRKVLLQVEVQRFFCRNVTCPRVTFAEPLAALTRRYARQTNQLQATLRELAFALGGEGGASMVKKLHYGALSPDTLLRMIRHAPQEQQPTPRHLGVDDWALKKGRTYGTILVDLERHTVVDLLPERTSEGLATWLKAHPGVEVITRDRAGSFAEGAAQGAPQAMQVADRFHLYSI